MNNYNWKSDPEEGFRKLIEEHKAKDSEDSKSTDGVKTTWINIKSLFYASLTLIAVIASLALLPLAIILVAGFVLFVFYKLIFTDSSEGSNTTNKNSK
jgi:hypothetical protein